MEDIPATSRVVNELEEKGCQEAADTTLEGILKVKIVVRDQQRSGLSHILDVFYNGGADTKYEFSVTKLGIKKRTTKCFFPRRLRNWETYISKQEGRK